MGFVGRTDPVSSRHNLFYALVGDFEDDRFVPHSDALQLLDFGTDFYAMQSFEAEARQIAIAWLFNGEDRKPPGSPYSGEMSLPRELSISADGRLRMTPVQEFEAAWPASSPPLEDGVIDRNRPFDLQLTGGPGAIIRISPRTGSKWRPMQNWSCGRDKPFVASAETGPPVAYETDTDTWPGLPSR